ncbi:DUF6817 domain-containing protein [Actinoplanes sp. NPDC051851]|uniref:DUF6817 domain-containing protein n=1 Tax=Actinoplanes sp. NPDC051851 TaxID=3154753 RepID=UPI00343D8F62
MTADIDARTWLRERGATMVEHPGGTLFAHLCRVEELLAELGHPRDVQLAGLTHAAYGTDGFPLALLDWTDRATLRNLIGTEAEALVYLYGACDRKRSWPHLAETHEVTDRFTDRVEHLTPAMLTPFIDLSIVNELDVIAQNPALLTKHGDYFRTLFTAWSPATSPPVAARIRHITAPA